MNPSYINIQFTIPDPKPLVLVSVTNQYNTALNTSKTYSVAGFFEDAHSRPLTYSTPTQSDGSPLPSWVLWNSASKVLTFNTNAVQSAVIKIAVTVPTGKSREQTFTASITNNAPTVISAMGSDSEYDNITYSYTKDLSTVFSDSNPLQTLTYTVDTTA